MICTLPGACGLRSLELHSPRCTSPWALRMALPAGQRGDWSCCCRRIPQSAPEGLFPFEKILLNPAAPYKEGPVLSHSPPLHLDWGLSRVRAGHDPTLNSPHPAPTVSVGLPLHPYSPPCNFKQPGVSWCCSNLVWQGREPLTGSPPGVLWQAQWAPGLSLQSPWSLVWSQGRFCPEAIPLLSVFSVSSILSGLLSS